MRELHIFLYLHLYFSSSSLVEFQEGKACPFLGPRGVIERRRKKKKQTVFKRGVPFSLFGLQQEAFALLTIWVSGDLDSCSKATRKAVTSHPLDLVAQLGQTEAVLRFRFSEQLSSIEALQWNCRAGATPFSRSPKLVGHRESGPLAGGQVEAEAELHASAAGNDERKPRQQKEQTVSSAITPHHHHPK